MPSGKDTGDTSTDTSDDAKVPEPGAVQVYAPCSLEKRWGRFRVTLNSKFSAVEGAVANGVVPAHVPNQGTKSGDCTMYKPPNLSCDPPCAPDKRCDRSGQCLPAPRNQDFGKVQVRGMKEAVDIAPKSPGFYYVNPETLSHPIIGATQTVHLYAGKAPGQALSLHAHGVDQLQGLPDKVAIVAGKDLELSWDAPSDTSRSKMVLNLNVNNHGAAASWISCEVQDNGSFALPSALLEELMQAGMSGFPSLTLTRMSVDSKELTLDGQEGQGCVELVVQSPVTIDVEVPGLVSCKDDSDCPEGQRCRDDLTCG